MTIRNGGPNKSGRSFGIECPYCYHVTYPRHYVSEVPHEAECEKCCKAFTVWAEHSISYISSPLQEPAE
jgi:hypothetical protein